MRYSSLYGFFLPLIALISGCSSENFDDPCEAEPNLRSKMEIGVNKGLNIAGVAPLLGPPAAWFPAL